MESNGATAGHEKKEVAVTPQDPTIFCTWCISPVVQIQEIIEFTYWRSFRSICVHAHTPHQAPGMHQHTRHSTHASSSRQHGLFCCIHWTEGRSFDLFCSISSPLLHLWAHFRQRSVQLAVFRHCFTFRQCSVQLAVFRRCCGNMTICIFWSYYRILL